MDIELDDDNENVNNIEERTENKIEISKPISQGVLYAEHTLQLAVNDSYKVANLKPVL